MNNTFPFPSTVAPRSFSDQFERKWEPISLLVVDYNFYDNVFMARQQTTFMINNTFKLGIATLVN